ncbi:hypothetical protein WJX72_007366 [[Myrmecia] bisecta]|uniref:Uncharacterized protein n=1 Tax=[Myrmecia] bisecta TaxID=41462 RepID=A0AAW1QRC9_9CHLO
MQYVLPMQEPRPTRQGVPASAGILFRSTGYEIRHLGPRGLTGHPGVPGRVHYQAAAVGWHVIGIEAACVFTVVLVDLLVAWRRAANRRLLHRTCPELALEEGLICSGLKTKTRWTHDPS